MFDATHIIIPVSLGFFFSEGFVGMVMDLHITHDRFDSRSIPVLMDTYITRMIVNDGDRSLNETVTDKIRQYPTDYNTIIIAPPSLSPSFLVLLVRLGDYQGMISSFFGGIG